MNDTMDQVETNVQERVLRPTSEVFDAIADPAKLSRYFISGSSGPLQAGTTVRWQFADVGAEIPVDIVEVLPDRKIVYEWTGTGRRTRVSISLTPVDAQTTAVAIHEGCWPMDRDGVSRAQEQTAGWTYFLCCLKAYVHHGVNLREGLVRRLTERP